MKRSHIKIRQAYSRKERKNQTSLFYKRKNKPDKPMLEKKEKTKQSYSRKERKNQIKRLNLNKSY